MNELFVNELISKLAKQVTGRNICDLFIGSSSDDTSSDDSSRVEKFSAAAAGLYLDYSKQNISETELTELIKWSEQLNLTEKIQAMFSGVKINNTENRAVLHTLLRAPEEQQQRVSAADASEIKSANQQMATLVNDVRQGYRLGITGKCFTDVLAIGIGGSFYGIKVGLSALQPYCKTGLKVHVLANIDGAAVAEKLALINAETTLVVVISKTFTTQETLLNACAVKNWMLAAFPQTDIMAQQWYAISTNIVKATAFGIQKENILPMWDWVGGRFSVWSAVGLPLALAIGMKHFNAFKRGAQHMDEHFKTAPARNNMPILMALIGIWNRNFLNYSALAILPYDHALRALPGYLQQTDMESNGKSVSTTGEKLTYSTAPIVFGQEGTNAQHAFMQLMHQSDEIIPTDFIVALQGTSHYKTHHQVLFANCLAQSEALMQGKTLAQARAELLEQGMSAQQTDVLAAHKTMKGNTPSNTLVLSKLEPSSLGALLALYEHKILVQGLIWQVNSFDQWGVELGKKLGEQVLKVMNGEQSAHLSPSSQALIARYNSAE